MTLSLIIITITRVNFSKVVVIIIIIAHPPESFFIAFVRFLVMTKPTPQSSSNCKITLTTSSFQGFSDLQELPRKLVQDNRGQAETSGKDEGKGQADPLHRTTARHGRRRPLLLPRRRHTHGPREGLGSLVQHDHGFRPIGGFGRSRQEQLRAATAPAAIPSATPRHPPSTAARTTVASRIEVVAHAVGDTLVMVTNNRLGVRHLFGIIR